MQEKKYGTFAGVFTPSILTILGVIMYMRLGWVVGESGLIYALSIIIIAHIISFSTGLSISAIATDKKIKTGGIYYILSRSLGLPMGGAIGIALAVGTALSISLYIIGFAESFLSISQISEFLHLPPNLNSYRIVGTAIMIVIVIIAFISTSLAIKMQFFILGAIVLSLVSIGLGFFGNIEFRPETVFLNPAGTGTSLEYVFSVFFPAVTGFTAGVAMSGDLKNPGKNIPLGTMAAILVGFVVYVSLAVGLAYFVDRDILINDTNFLLKVAWSAPLVVAGIWGATLSSALGGILGGPRIFQAISGDGILPRFLGKGYGASNEPRNALIFVFLLAEIGIMIGELNVIASVVSMFYLASYGFINLVYAFESWASTDFRPSFRIPRFVSIVGAIASFAVMFRLDPVAMFVALFIMFIIYFFLKRKELSLDYGDVWQSVWLSVIRTGLFRLGDKEIEERNWRPNIILFSGGNTKRQHLLELGKSIAGKHGILSNFDLIQKKDSESNQQARHEQTMPIEGEGNEKVFSRQHFVRDIYDGIEIIASTYGFSGIEPNTVLMGWGRQTKDPVRFVELMKKLYKLDLNLVMVDYAPEQGFGRKRTIDIWWREPGKQGNLALVLSKLLMASEEWPHANLRLLIVNSYNNDYDIILKNTHTVLDNMRIKAKVQVINNEIEQNSFYDIIRNESLKTDLIFIGIPEILPDNAVGFIDQTNDLLSNVGTVVLIRASSQFKSLNLGESKRAENKKTDIKQDELQPDVVLPKLLLPKNNTLARELEHIQQSLEEAITEFHQNYLVPIDQVHARLLQKVEKTIMRLFGALEKELPKASEPRDAAQLVSRTYNSFFAVLRHYLDDFQTNNAHVQKERMSAGLLDFIEKLDQIVHDTPKIIIKTYNLSDLSYHRHDKRIKGMQFFKRINRARIKISGHPYRYKLKFNNLLKVHYPIEGYQNLFRALEEFGTMSIHQTVELNQLGKAFQKSLLKLENAISDGHLTTEYVEREHQDLLKQLHSLVNYYQHSQERILHILMQNNRKSLQKLSNRADFLAANSYTKKKSTDKYTLQKVRDKLQAVPSLWLRNQKLHYSSLLLELKLYTLENQVKRVFRKAVDDMEQAIVEGRWRYYDALFQLFEKYRQEVETEDNIEFVVPEQTQKLFDTALVEKIASIADGFLAQIQEYRKKIPEQVTIITEESYNNFTIRQFSEIESMQIAASELCEFILNDSFIMPVRQYIKSLLQHIEESDSEVQDLIRLSAYSMSSPQNAKQRRVMKQFVKEQIDKLSVSRNRLVELRETSVAEQVSWMKQLNERFTYFNFIRHTATYKQYVRDREKKVKFTFFRPIRQKITNYILQQLNKLLYRQSEAVLLARSLNTEPDAYQSVIGKSLKLVEQLSIKPRIKQSLPFYYQQLFSDQSSYDAEFWFNRNPEIEQAEKIYERFRAGSAGAMLVIGERKSGKSFFIQRFIDSHAEVKAVIKIEASRGGSTQVIDFESLFVNEQDNKTPESILQRAAKGSIVVFEDIELWWEKSEGGLEVIKRMAELIQLFGKRHFFILSGNDLAYRVINKLFPLEHFVQGVVYCGAVKAETLKQILLFRQKSSGIRVVFRGKELPLGGSLDYARIFNRIFGLSRGNIGMALNYWNTGIETYSDKTIELGLLKVPDMSVLQKLQTEHHLMLIQLILHRQMTLSSMRRVLLLPRAILSEHLNYLVRAGIIKRQPSNIYEVQLVILPYLIDYFIKKELL